MSDLRYAVRMLAKTPGFAVAAVLTLAFGIGVNLNLFGMVNAFFLQPLRVPDAHELTLILQRSSAINLPHGYSYLDFRDLRERNRSFKDLAAVLPIAVHFSTEGQAADRTWVEVASPNYFRVAGIRCALGTAFQEQDEASRDGNGVVLTHSYWQRRFGSDRSVVGRTIQLNGEPFTVLGVTPPGFSGMHWSMALSAIVPSGAVPRLYAGEKGLLDDRGAPAWRLVGRLRESVSIEQARADIGSLADELKRNFPEQHKGTSPLVVPEIRARPDPAFADFMPFFTILFIGIVALVLFIACANVANLMLARGLARRRELTLRAALGAGRARLIRQLLIESVLLAAIAAIAGYFLADWAGHALNAFTPKSDIPLNMDHPNDWRTYAFTALLAVVTGLAAGLIPALQATRLRIQEGLKEASARVSHVRHPFRNFLVVSQVTFSVIVLICAGLFMRSLSQFRHVALGFEPERVLMLSLDLGLQKYSDQRGRNFLDDLLLRSRSLPGVTSVSLTRQVPFDYGLTITEIVPEASPVEEKLAVAYTIVDSEYHATMGTPIHRGRGFTSADRVGAPGVAIINERLAETLWPGQDPLGKRFRNGSEWVEVVGVTSTGKYFMLGEPPRPFLYLPLAQNYVSPISLVVRTDSDPVRVTAALQSVVRELDPHLPIYNVRTLNDHIRNSALALMPIRLGAALAALQGSIGVLLAVMGLYAVVAYGVAQRTQEIGIRIALGAQKLDLFRLVLREGMNLTLVGIAVGLLVAVGIAVVMSRFLFGVSPLDFGVYAAAVGLLLLVAGIGCYVPVRRAGRVDPIIALRCE